MRCARTTRNLLAKVVIATSAAAFVTLSFSAPASAFTHVVREGENLSSLANKFYGSPSYEVVLVAANGLDLQGGSKPVPGMRLEIPSLGSHRAEPGETWYSIATRTLGDGRRADLLARANHAVAWIPPADGQSVVLPYHLTVVAVDGETVFRLSTRFYGNATRAWEINAYNGFNETSAFKRGDVVLIPLTDLPLTNVAKLEEQASTFGFEDKRDARPVIEKEVGALALEMKRGDFVAAIARGNRILALRGLLPEETSRTLFSLVEAYVSLGAFSLAERTCAAFRAVDPKAVLEPVYTSPKILRACTPPANEAPSGAKP